MLQKVANLNINMLQIFQMGIEPTSFSKISVQAYVVDRFLQKRLEGLKSKCPRLCDLHRAYLDQGFGSRSWNIGSEVIGLAGDRVPLHAWPCRNHVRPWVLG